MKIESNRTEANSYLTRYLPILGCSNEEWNDILRKCLDEKYFGKIGAILAVIISVMAMIITTEEYIAKYVILKMHHVDICYLELNHDFEYKLIAIIALIILYIILNYIVFIIFSIKNKLKKIICVCFLYLGESIGIYYLIGVYLFYDFTGMLPKGRKEWGLFVFMFVLLLSISWCLNSFGYEKAIFQSESGKDSKTKKSINNYISYFWILLVATVLILVFIIVSIMIGEKDREIYKVLPLAAEESDDFADEYIFLDNKTSENMLYAIVYENEDVYITSPMEYDSNYKRVIIDHSMQRIFEKDSKYCTREIDLKQAKVWSKYYKKKCGQK